MLCESDFPVTHSEPVSDSRTEEPVSVSQHETSDRDEDDQMEHEFLYRNVYGKSGKNVGKVSRMVTLFIPCLHWSLQV